MSFITIISLFSLNPTEDLEVRQYDGQTSHINEQQLQQLQHERNVTRLRVLPAMEESEMRASQRHEMDARESVEVQIERHDEREERPTRVMEIRHLGEPYSHANEDEVRDFDITQARQVERELMSYSKEKPEGEEFINKPRLTVSFLPSRTEMPSSEVTLTPPSFSAVSNLSQISKSELDLDITQPQLKYM